MLNLRFLFCVFCFLSGLSISPAFAEADGPDYLQVAGIASNDTLNVRTAPSTKGRIIARLASGTLVRNMGCRKSGNQRWCKISARNGSFTGWAAGRYLREASNVRVPSSNARAQRVKCKGRSRDCLRDARRICQGSYRVLDSESHAGGLVVDTIPGPVTWYSLTFRCGRSDGRRATFLFQGRRFDPSTLSGGNNGSGRASVSVRQMSAYCRGEASAKFGTRPTNIETRRPQLAGSSYFVYGRIKHTGRNFQCRFRSNGRFLFVR